MRQVICLLLGLGSLLPSAAAMSDEIVRWTDENGVTQFGDPQFAPPERYQPVEVAPTNSMVVHEMPHERQRAEPTVITLSRTKFENKRGFRGFDRRPSAGQRRAR